MYIMQNGEENELCLCMMRPNLNPTVKCLLVPAKVFLKWVNYGEDNFAKITGILHILVCTEITNLIGAIYSGLFYGSSIQAQVNWRHQKLVGLGAPGLLQIDPQDPSHFPGLISS